MKEQQSIPKFKLCYTENNPHDVVVLREPQKIIELMFQVKQNLFIWITEGDPQQEEWLLEAERISGIQFHKVNSYGKCLQFIKRHYHQQINMIIESLNQLSQDFLAIVRQPQLVKVYLQLSYSKLLNPQHRIDKVSFFEDKVELIGLLQSLNQKASDFRSLPSFTLAKGESWTSKASTETMYAMINQKISPEGRIRIVEELQILLDCVYQESTDFQSSKSTIKDFLNELKSGPMKLEQAIYWYTFQSPVFKFTNNLLRVSQHPGDAFFIQPYFKDLFQTISSLHKNQRQRKQYLQFIAYRGGLSSSQQLQYFQNNVGQVVQNLGFLSTTLVKDQIVGYIENVTFEIIVDSTQWDISHDSGYAFIAEHSFYSTEQEVLFNPFNYFRVLEVSSYIKNNNKITFVKLKFGEDSRVMNKKKQLLTEEDKWFRSRTIFQKFEATRIPCQGKALTKNYEYLSGYNQYWEKYTQLAQGKFFEKVNGLMLLLDVYACQGNYERARKMMAQCNKIMEKVDFSRIHEMDVNPSVFYNHCLQHCQIEDNVNLIKCYERLQSYIQYQKSKNDKLEKFIRIQMLFKVVDAYSYIGNIKLALQTLQKAANQVKNFEDCPPGIAALCCFKLGFAEMQKGQIEKGLQQFRNGQKIVLKNQGEKSMDYILTLYAFSDFYMKSKNYQESLRLDFKCLQILEEIVQFETRMQFQLHRDIGNTYFLMKNYKSSLQHYKIARGIKYRIHPIQNPSHLSIISRIAELEQILKEIETTQKLIQYLYSVLSTMGEQKSQQILLPLYIALIDNGDQQIKAIILSKKCENIIKSVSYAMKYYLELIQKQQNKIKSQNQFADRRQIEKLSQPIQSYLKLSYILQELGNIDGCILLLQLALPIISKMEEVHIFLNIAFIVFRSVGYHEMLLSLIRRCKVRKQQLKDQKQSSSIMKINAMIKQNIFYTWMQMFNEAVEALRKWFQLFMALNSQGQLNLHSIGCFCARNHFQKIKQKKKKTENAEIVGYFDFD